MMIRTLRASERDRPVGRSNLHKLLASLAALALAMTACGDAGEGAPAGADTGTEDVAAGSDEEDEDFDLDALIEAAQAEGEVVSWNQSSRVVDACEAFEEKYGITCSGTKIDSPEQNERVRREVDAGNVTVDVLGYNDGPVLQAELLDQGYVENWFPPDLVDIIPEQYHDPVTYIMPVPIFGYNTEAYDTCPVSNVWEMVESDWQNKFALRDPSFSAAFQDVMGQLVLDWSDVLEQSYEDHYGEPLETDEENASWEWIKRLAQLDPIVSGSDGDIAEAIGAPGQSDPPIGYFGLTNFRNIESAGLQLGFCEDIEPFKGALSTNFLAIVRDSPNPNAARLFVRFLLTEEGVAPWAMRDIGTFSTNPEVPVHEDDPMGSLEAWEQVMVQPLSFSELYELRPQIAEFWERNS
jgi:iron(III) transport system substrate-binding protein